MFFGKLNLTFFVFFPHILQTFFQPVALLTCLDTSELKVVQKPAKFMQLKLQLALLARLTFRPSEACEYEWGPLRRLSPPGVLSEKEGEGELGGRVMELIKLGPLSILHKMGWDQGKD